MGKTLDNPHLAGLPPCVVAQCHKCERDLSQVTWIDRRYGCSVCSGVVDYSPGPENESNTPEGSNG